VTELALRRLLAAAVAVALAAQLAAGGCSHARKIDPMGLVAPEIDVEQERELGYEFDQAIQKQLRVIDDPLVAGFMNDLGREILAGAGTQPHIYRFRVIEQDSLNAFAIFGGYVYFHTGTLLAAGSLDELAGVMGHEIAHVRLRHHARMEKQTQLPKLLASLAGIAATVATGEPAALMASQGVNVALELHWSREFESEADREGMRLQGRAGLRPDAIAHFFERIVAEKSLDPLRIPPYLYSHPDVEKRIDSVRTLSSRVEVIPHDNSALRAAFTAAKERLRTLLPKEGAPRGPSRAAASADVETLLSAANGAAVAGQPDQALLLLRDAAARAPDDPRIHYRIGELEAEASRHEAAAAAFQRTIEIDPTRALTFFRLGESTKALGDKQRAVYAFEQAARRAGAAGSLRARADWEVVKLTFPVVVESGLSDRLDPKTGALGLPVERYAPGTRNFSWWGRLGPRYLEQTKDLTAAWIPPDGKQGEATPLRVLDQGLIATALELPPPGATVGTWTLELQLQGDVMMSRSVIVAEPSAR
jgi:predicted Zn-dependent protease